MSVSSIMTLLAIAVQTPCRLVYHDSSRRPGWGGGS
jgi:hypothetical protein